MWMPLNMHPGTGGLGGAYAHLWSSFRAKGHLLFFMIWCLSHITSNEVGAVMKQAGLCQRSHLLRKKGKSDGKAAHKQPERRACMPRPAASRALLCPAALGRASCTACISPHPPPTMPCRDLPHPATPCHARPRPTLPCWPSRASSTARIRPPPPPPAPCCVTPRPAAPLAHCPHNPPAPRPALTCVHLLSLPRPAAPCRALPGGLCLVVGRYGACWYAGMSS